MTAVRAQEGWEVNPVGTLAERDRLRAGLQGIVDAERFNKQEFGDDTHFADWAQNRAHYLLKTGTGARP